MQYKNFQRGFILLAVLIFTLLPACDDNDPSVNAGRLRVKLTDATDVTIKELYLQIQEISVYATDTANAEGEWIKLEYNGGEYDLLKLLNGRQVQLSEQYFPAGKSIQSIRLVFGHDSRIETITDKTHALHFPPEIVEGAVIDLIEPITIRPNIISGIVIDVNAALSVRESNGNYFLHPVVRVFPEAYGSSLRGYISPPPREINAVSFVAIIRDPDTLLTYPDADGMFLFPGLPKGSWEVHLVANPTTAYTDTAFIWNIDTTGIVDITPRPIRMPRAFN